MMQMVSSLLYTLSKYNLPSFTYFNNVNTNIPWWSFVCVNVFETRGASTAHNGECPTHMPHCIRGTNRLYFAFQVSVLWMKKPLAHSNWSTVSMTSWTVGCFCNGKKSNDVRWFTFKNFQELKVFFFLIKNVINIFVLN